METSGDVKSVCTDVFSINECPCLGVSVSFESKPKHSLNFTVKVSFKSVENVLVCNFVLSNPFFIGATQVWVNKIVSYNVFVTLYKILQYDFIRYFTPTVWSYYIIYDGPQVVFMHRISYNMRMMMTIWQHKTAIDFFLFFFFKGKCKFSLCHSPQLFMSLSFAKHSPSNSSN